MCASVCECVCAFSAYGSARFYTSSLTNFKLWVLFAKRKRKEKEENEIEREKEWRKKEKNTVVDGGDENF